MPARCSQLLLMMAGRPSLYAFGVCEASTATTFTFDASLSMSAGVGVSVGAPSRSVNSPAWTSTLMARPWLDGSFGIATSWPSMPSSESWSFQNRPRTLISPEPMMRRSSPEVALYWAW